MVECVSEKELDDPLIQDLFLKGDDLQKLSVIQALPQLLETDYNATISRILPKIQQELPNSSTEFHIATSNMFKLLFEMKLSINLLRPVLQGIDSKDPIISTAWIETLLAIIPNLSHPSLLNEVLPFTLRLTHLNRNIFYRVSSCKILGQIAIHPKISKFEVKKDILPAAQSLCQDCLYEVRAAMCTELPNIAKGLASDVIVKSSLLPCLVELSSDENMLVRASAVDSVVCLITYLTPSTVTSTIIPLVKKLCEESSKEGDHTFTCVAKSYGTLLENLQSELSLEDSVWFFSFYRQLSKKGLSIGKEELEIETSLALMCRERCAYNLPAVTYFVISKIPQEIGEWERIFRDLSGDPCYLVRKAVASCIQEITRILGNDSKVVVSDFVKLLRDESEEVLDALVPNISTTLECLNSSAVLSVDNSSQITIEIARALLKCQVEIFKYHNWRRKKIFLEQIECLPNCMPGDFIHQHFTQVVIALSLDARARPVKTHAVKTVLHYLRCSTKENHRKWIRDWFTNNLLASKSCYIRHIFINMCQEAMHIFSWKYFKEYFFSPLLTLADDPVSTVRLCLAKFLPFLKQMLVIPIDRNLQVKLDTIISKMEMTEKDKDVIFTLKSSITEMRNIHGMNTEQLMDEKRKIEDEERIMQGRLTRVPISNSRVKSIYSSSVKSSRSASHKSSVSAIKSAGGISNKSFPSPAKLSVGSISQTSNEMTFLVQHFFTDAGVVLPEKSEIHIGQSDDVAMVEENLQKLNLNNNMPLEPEICDENITTLSAENLDIENMSDADLKVLETSVTNITDDVKVNLQKINKSKTLGKLSVEAVKKRNKRYSCVLPRESNLPIPVMYRRRSLTINPAETSRIPISFRSKKNEEFAGKYMMGKIVNNPTVNNKCDDFPSPSQSKNISKTSSVESFVKENSITTADKVNNEHRNNDNNNQNELKENIPMNSIAINVPKIKKGNIPKASGLPILTKKARPDSAKI